MATVATDGGLEFGLFDWLDESGRDIGATYEERLQMVAYADEAGFYCYHLAEHHGNELSTVPSPNLFLSAVAQRTRRLHLGPLGYVLPTYNPLRLLEEVCMLDQLSGGRLEVGIGRGSSPHEVAFFGVKPEETREIFNEELAILRMGWTQGEVTFSGRHFQYDHVLTRLYPRQRPYPPLWYPTSNAESIPWLASQGFNTIFAVHLAPTFDQIVTMLQRYREALAEHRGDPDRINGHVAQPRYGFSLLVHVAETDELAERQARVAYAQFIHNFTYRYIQRGLPNKYADRMDFDGERARGRLLVGSPDTVRGVLQDYLERSGANYCLLTFAFGSMPIAQTLSSMDLFTREVRPALTAVPR